MQKNFLINLNYFNMINKFLVKNNYSTKILSRISFILFNKNSQTRLFGNLKLYLKELK